MWARCDMKTQIPEKLGLTRIKAKRKGGAFALKAPPRGVDDGIPPPGPRQSLCWRKGARREVSLRLCREDCHRQSSPTTTCGCREFESRHANAQQKAPYLSRYGAYLLFKGPSRGANSQGLCHHFLFYRNCKKCHFWQFTAPFGLQLRQIAF